MNQDDDKQSSSSGVSSYVSCYSSFLTLCGSSNTSLDNVDTDHTTSNNANINTGIMQRASISRRADHLSSPVMRSRSQEGLRTASGGGTTATDNDNSDDEAIRALQQSEHYPDSEHLDLSGKQLCMEDGSTTASSSSRGHRRAMSDPFDAQEDDDGDDDDAAFQAALAGVTVTTKTAILPTLPRYPVADQRNKNCWSEPPVSIFRVRGQDYFSKKKKKVASGPYLLPGRGVDLFLADHVVDYVNTKSDAILGGNLRKRPTLVVNFRFPWGNMLLYFEIPAKLKRYLTDAKATPVAVDTTNLTIQEQTLAAWFQGDTDYRNDRLKLIPYVAQGPWVVRNMVTGKPALIGKKLPVGYVLSVATAEKEALLECTLDIGSSSATAKRIVSVCRRYMSALTVDIGFVIQAETAEELPEQMMGSLRIHGADPIKAPKL